MEHKFSGVFITDAEFADLAPRGVFHRQLDRVDLPCTEHRDRHILFRKKFTLEKRPAKATAYITADDRYKLYVNGNFVCEGPAPSYHFAYGYNEVDVTDFLREGENVVAVHTLYYGMINRVLVSGDLRHGLLFDIEADGSTVAKSDESVLTAAHDGYRETGVIGYETQFAESFDSASACARFERADFDDSAWKAALPRKTSDWTVTAQKTPMPVFETVLPAKEERRGNVAFYDFGACFVGYLEVTAAGKKGDAVTVRCGQELCEDGSVRYKMRCNCVYEEKWLLSGGTDALSWFDYKSFRYAELELPEGCGIESVSLRARHYPFYEKAALLPEYAGDAALEKIWALCVRSQKYGVQDVIQDCMDREKGFYVGDGCYTALTNLLLTHDDRMSRKLIDDFFASTFITPTGVTCLDCAVMQEIAEYPLMVVPFCLWRYRAAGDKEYLAKNYENIKTLLEAYRAEYEKDGLLSELDKWCVVEWPKNFQDGYDVDITEGKVCHEPHVALNAYYIEAIRTANVIAETLGLPPYRDEAPLRAAFRQAFFDEEKQLHRDSDRTAHTSFIGNVFVYAYKLYASEKERENIERMIEERGAGGVSLFGAFAVMLGLLRHERYDLLKKVLSDPNAWLRMISEGATTTFESWSADTKWNTSLFHLTFSYAAAFMCDARTALTDAAHF